MGFTNPDVPWSELERRLSDRPASAPAGGGPDADRPGDGSDAPAWSRRRAAYEPPADLSAGAVPGDRPRSGYAELHCHSACSFLDGASLPEALVTEAARLGLDALALTDHDGCYGVVRFAEAARAVGLPTVFGVELTLNAEGPRAGPPDPSGEHLLVLARDPEGYAALSSLVAQAQMAGEKGHPRLSFAEVAEAASGRARGHWAVLTAGRKGVVPARLAGAGPAAAERELRSLVAAFGSDHTFVELWDHGDPLDSARNDALAGLATRVGLRCVATNAVHYATPAQRRLASALAAVRSRRSLDEIDGWLPAGWQAHLRSADEQRRRFARHPGAVEAAGALGRECAFDLSLVAPALPPYPCPAGPDGAPLTEAEFLRLLVDRGGVRRYGPRHAERVPGAWVQIDHELDLIEQLGFCGYFLVVWDIVEFCRRSAILCQGRGSAANSAVCFALGVTAVDAVQLGLLFERFLSPARDGPPDIDLDIESDRREEVIQYVYQRYGRSHAAQVANVITYRARSAVRDAARALGYAPGQQDAWSRQVDRCRGVPAVDASLAGADAPGGVDIPSSVLELAAELEDLPRHLGIHSGGMVICDRPVVEVCPVEWASMPGRSVLQWDKDDCAGAGLVKFDLLGLGMLSALHRCVDLVRDHHGVEVELATIPQEDAVYDMLCRADSVGVFQVESRAQMATLPRLRPRCFYDLVVEVALIRPGPIQGGSVHPYIRRRRGEEPVTYLHPALEPALAKTLGVPLFQEQLMQVAIDVAGFTPAEADQLRQAMGSKRSTQRMAALRARFDAGLAERGLVGQVARDVWDKLAAFANYGFPESHSVSFAHLVYASAWFKHHYPAAFCVALLNSQPMGFYSPQSLVQDARRHGVEVLGPDVQSSADVATLRGGRLSPVVRLGLSSIRGVGADLAARIADGAPYRGLDDLARRTGADRSQLESLATAGAFGSLSDRDGRPLDRRRALWTAGAAAEARPDRLPGTTGVVEAPRLPGMDPWEESVADLWSTGVTPSGHPFGLLREELDRRGVVPAVELAAGVDGSTVRVAGVVTHRQRPATARGVTFLNLEDDTGLVNVVVSVGCWERHRRVVRDAPALCVRGRLERTVDGVVNVVAHRIESLDVQVPASARDFR